MADCERTSPAAADDRDAGIVSRRLQCPFLRSFVCSFVFFSHYFVSSLCSHPPRRFVRALEKTKQNAKTRNRKSRAVRSEIKDLEAELLATKDPDPHAHYHGHERCTHDHDHDDGGGGGGGDAKHGDERGREHEHEHEHGHDHHGSGSTDAKKDEHSRRDHDHDHDHA